MTEYIIDSEPNYRAIFLITVFAFCIALCIAPIFLETPSGYYKDASGNLVKIPYGYILAKNGTPIPVVSLTPIIITNTVYVTPTPDNGIYYASENMEGVRKLGRYFVYDRKDVLGLKDLSAHVTVYGYKMLDSYHFWNLADNTYVETIPTGEDYKDKKFLFIYVQFYTDMIEGDDVRPYLPDEQHFQVSYEGVMYSPIAFKKELRIKEFEETFTKDDSSRIRYYGQFTAQALQGKYAGKPISQQHFYSYGGNSNAEDGYIVYEIPKRAEAKDITVWSTFYSFGSSQWVLKT